MRLPLDVRLKLARQRVLATLGLNGNVPVRLEECGEGGVIVVVDDQRIHAPSARRWKLYRWGWAARLDRLEREYGVGRHFRLDRGAVILDVGANVGEFAFVAERYGARILAFEPDPKVFACLKRNVESLAFVKAYEDVVWKSDGEIDFALAPERADSSVFAVGPKVRKRAVTLASVISAEGLQRVDLLKCDAEGAEPEVLEGAGEALLKIAGVALDTGPERNGARTDRACAEILVRAGFDVIEETIGGRMMTFGVKQNA